MKKICFLFPGQGSQKLGMGKELTEISDAAKNVFYIASEVLNYDLFEVCTNSTQEKLNETQYAQPAIVATSIAAFEILKEKGLTPSFLAGHSLGQYSALYAANVLSLKDTFRLLSLRIDAIKNANSSKDGAMCAVLGLDAKTIEKECEMVDGYVIAANFNCPMQTVISGEKEAVLQVFENLKDRAKRCVMLNVSKAFHSDLMKEAAEIFKEKIQNFNFKDPSIPIISNVTSNIIKNGSEIKNLLVLHLTHPVLFTKMLELLRKENVSSFIELGFGKTLCNLVKKTLINTETFSLQDKTSYLKICENFGV